ncbi:unnamed protein product [Alopecurus aequalis]
MELVVGASVGTMKSVMTKLGSLLAQEYALTRGVEGDLQYINDELASMESFLCDLSAVGGGQAQSHGHRMKDWMKQIRDITYDIEDCIDDSAHRLRGLYPDTWACCLFNHVLLVCHWWPRRDIAARISVLKMRAQQIGERRSRYGVNNPEDVTNGSAVGFDAAGNQQASLQLVSMKDPVGVDDHMKDLEKSVTCIVGFGGVGKTAIANALYSKFGDQFEHRAMVTVSQSSDLEAILTSIKNQVNPQVSNYEQQGSSEKNRLVAAISGSFRRGISFIMAKCCSTGTSEKTRHRTKLDLLKKDLEKHFEEKSYLVLIDDVWSATMLDKIINELPNNTKSRIIATTRFHAVATRRGEEGDVRKIQGLFDKESLTLFEQAFLESEGKKSDMGKVPHGVWKMCGGLPLAIVTMAGHVACNPNKSEEEWLRVCKSLFPDLVKYGGEELTQEEVGKILSYCYNDMPSEIKTCSLYLSIFPKGHRISRKRLTRRWISEGFVCEKQGLSVDDVADTYFNHLIRRKIIRSVDHSSNGKVKNIVVHDMVLEHIVAKASEENFITVVGGNWLMPPPTSKVRRLSLQGSDSKRAKDTKKMKLSHVRSLTLFGNLNNKLPSNSFNFDIVQVLDLEGCTGFKPKHTKEICKMLLLKYLSLRLTDTKELPQSIGKLVNLETLDIRETNIVELPKAICQLEQLVNILGGNKATRMALRLPEELNKKKKMKALRTLSGIELGGSADLHHLTELRKLAIYKLKTEGSDVGFKELSSSIEYLGGYSLHTLLIVDESSEFLKSLGALSTPPKFLMALELSGKMVELPSWVAKLSALNKLTLSVTALRTDNLEDLSNLKALFSLTFSFPFSAEKHDAETQTIIAQNKLHSDGKVIVPAGGFEKLKLLRFSAPLLPSLSFAEGAMPELERLELRFDMLEGLSGVEYHAELKVVHLTLVKKSGEQMTRKITSEIESAVKRTGAKTPKIIIAP